MVDSLCAMIKIVVSPWSSSIAFIIFFSFSVSMLLVASSNISSVGFRSNARANASRCLSPPDNFTPRSPMNVSRPSGSFDTNSLAEAEFNASLMSFSLAFGWANSKLKRIVSLNRNVS